MLDIIKVLFDIILDILLSAVAVKELLKKDKGEGG
jgi:hypothetical protein